MVVPMPSALQSVPIPSIGVLLSRLPATARAGIQWAQPYLADAYRRLRTEPLDDALVMQVTESAWLPLRHLWLTVVKAVAGNPGLYQGIIDESLNEARRVIARALPDDTDRIDTLDWILTWQRSFVRPFVPMMEQAPETLDALAEDSDLLRRLCRAPEGGLLRAQMLVGAAEDATRAELDPERLGALIDQAFLEICRGVDATRATAPWVPSFPFHTETPAARGARATRYAEAFRSAGTEEQIEAFRRALETRSG